MPDILSLVVSGIAMLSTVIGWVSVVQKASNRRVELDTETKNQITNMNEKINNTNEKINKVEKVVANGGLKEAVSGLQVKCAAEMSRLITTVENHIEQPGHKGVSERIAQLDARVKNLEDESRDH